MKKSLDNAVARAATFDRTFSVMTLEVKLAELEEKIKKDELYCTP